MNRSSAFILFITLYIAGVWICVNYFHLGDKASQYQEFLDQKVVVESFVVSDPEEYVYSQQRFEVVPVTKFSQKILVTASSKDGVRYGDKIYIIGKIKSPKNYDEYDYVHYLKARNIYALISSPQIFIIESTLKNPIVYYGLQIKHFVYQKFQKYLPKEQSSLLIALIVGQKDLLSKDTITDFQVTGVAHLIAVSGFILTLLILFADKFSVYLGSKKTFVICFAVATIYVVMAGFAAGVIRAAIMSGVYLLSKKLNRQYNILPALGLTAAILITLNPLIVRYDLGFALSFVSILGIVLWVPIFRIIFNKLPEQFQIKEIICTTLAAQIVTLPLTIHSFKELSLIATVTNLLVVPMVPVVLWIGYFLCVPLIGKLVAAVVILPLNYILLIVLSLAKIPHASINVSLTNTGMVIVYIVEACAYLVGLWLLKEQLMFDRMLK